MRNSVKVCSILLTMLLLGSNSLAVEKQPGFEAPTDQGTSNQSLFPKPPFGEPLFGDPLFPDDNVANQLDADVSQTRRQQQQQAQQRIQAQAEAGIDQKINNAQIDATMRQQVSAVAQWLFRYGLRNRNEFPGYQTDQEEMWAAQVQLSELVPNNPYNYGNTKTIVWGIPAATNANGSYATGAPVWNDNWTNHLAAQQANRIQLSIDYGISAPQLDEWAKSPPDTWKAAPGTIIGVGNNQGLFYVWGADATGRPVRNPMNGKAYVVSGRTSGTVNDQAAPNEV